MPGAHLGWEPLTWLAPEGAISYTLLGGNKVLGVRYPEIPGGRGGEAKIGGARPRGTASFSSTRSSDPVGSGLSRGTELVSRLARGIRVRSRRHSVVRQHRSYILDKNERVGGREQGFLLKNIKERVFFRVPRRRGGRAVGVGFAVS